jgi:hypothetical protein
MTHKTDEATIAKIRELRYKGYSYDRIAVALDIGRTTARIYSPEDAVTKVAAPGSIKYPFTKRQLEIAMASLEKQKREGVIPESYWHRNTV